MNKNGPVRDLDPSLLRAFVAVVDAGTFSRAARRLNRTQSTLSMQIKRLEELVDADLFDRGSRPPTLTPAGEKLVSYARELVSLNDTALEDIRSGQVSGQVRLGLMEDIATTRLAPLLGRFHKDHPDVLVEVETGLTSEFIDMLGSRFDILVIMTGRDFIGGDLLYRGKTVWGAAPGFDPHAHQVLPVALSRHGCLFRTWATAALDRSGRRWHTGLVSTSVGAVTAAVRAGWCVSVFKDVTLPDDLSILGASDGLPALPDFEIRLLRAPSAGRGAVRAFDLFLRAQFRALGPEPGPNHPSLTA